MFDYAIKKLKRKWKGFGGNEKMRFDGDANEKLLFSLQMQLVMSMERSARFSNKEKKAVEEIGWESVLQLP